jgi:hypothetical protein
MVVVVMMMTMMVVENVVEEATWLELGELRWPLSSQQ